VPADKIVMMIRIARIAGGFTLIGAGTAMLVLPGPGLVTIFGGLTLLGKDLVWAKRITDAVKKKAVDRAAEPTQLGG
jgi:hypothetical protein